MKAKRTNTTIKKAQRILDKQKRDSTGLFL